ncbi:unannotated protein [freshwater metagenome]|uniref:Unannotated protein n=1 Tax=freshwater metagenome TaxID=449393 RepID=A0A6J7UHZ6_9ZZZZ
MSNNTLDLPTKTLFKDPPWPMAEGLVKPGISVTDISFVASSTDAACAQPEPKTARMSCFEPNLSTTKSAATLANS